MPAAKAESRTPDDVQRSNSTTNAFIGGTQKAWMTGQLPKSTPMSCTPNVSMVKVTDPTSNLSQRADLTPEKSKVMEDSELPGTTFGPHFDRGRFPAQRPRCGVTNDHASRSSTYLASAPTPLVLSPPALDERSYTLPIIPTETSTNAENVLPSPSPSVEARQTSVNRREIEEENSLPQVSEAPSVEGQMSNLEELLRLVGGVEQVEELLKDSEKSSQGPSQVAASAAVQDLPISRPSDDPPFRRQAPISKSQPSTESDHVVQVPSIANKRPQESTDEPRKRLQSLPSSSCEDFVAFPAATTVLPSQQDRGSAIANPSGIDMHPFVQSLAQQIQLVTNLPNRKGSHVERPRLDLLREACENFDYFYLVLHQLFCFDHQTRKSFGLVAGLNERHRKGLDVVAFLLVSNDAMVDEAVAWFSVFPLPWGKMQYTSAHAKVLRCLERMAKFWNELRTQCRERKYPPLVDELVVLFNVESFLFQQIIFRAVLRDIWSNKTDNCNCFLIAERLFNKDNNAVMGRLLSGTTTVELAKEHQSVVIQEYQQLSGSHWQHQFTRPTASPAAPVQQRRQSRLAPANNRPNDQNKNQHEHNKSTQAPLTLDLHRAQRHSLSATCSTPTSGQENQASRRSSLLSQSQALVSNTFPSPQVGSFTQSPTTLQGFVSPEASNHVPWQSNGQQQQRERRTSSTAATLRNAPESTTPIQRTPHVLPSNVPGNTTMHQFQQPLGPRQSRNEVPSSTAADPRPRPLSGVRGSLSSRSSETTLPTLSPHSFIHSSPSLSTHGNPTPFIRPYPPLPAHPNPVASALHQAHLRSPTLSYLDSSKQPNSMARYYRFIKHVLMPPEELDSKNRHVNWNFNLSKDLIDWFACDTPGSYGAPPTRAVTTGSRLCRIRCINFKDKPAMPTQSEWAVADNVWPGSTAVILNGVALDIRKKTHHGKDLPIDVTSYIKAGQNNLSTAVIGFEKDSTSKYAIGVEIIQVVDEQQIKSEIRTLPWLEARKRILDQSKNLDPDIEVLQSQKVLDLTDPFTARIFDVPVRGINCQHNQCFDRDTFLQTRTGKTAGEACGPDEFRCPICGQDARPQSLMIDAFFLGVRMALETRDRLEVKAIILRESGEWEIKEEEEVSGESGDGTGRRSAGLAGARSSSGSGAKASAPREVIEIDDDDDDDD